MPEGSVAIIGRPNVGKSTLFNRLAGARQAIVTDEPGTTRDRIFATITHAGKEFLLVDTGGFITQGTDDLGSAINNQVRQAITHADVVVLVVDTKTGLMPMDQDIAQEIRRLGKKALLVANKCDIPKHDLMATEFFALGLGDPLPLSAIHGRGIDELLNHIIQKLPDNLVTSPPSQFGLAIVGRPNVGKSSLLNAITHDERAIVHESPGTTRDSVDTLLDFKGTNVLLIDTAGISRPKRQGVGISRYSLLRTLSAIKQADVVALVLDATEILTAQDKHIAGRISDEAKGIIVVVNKWDIAPQPDKAALTDYIRSSLDFLPPMPIVYTSAKTGYGTDKIIPEALKVFQERQKRLSTSQVNSFVQEATARFGPPGQHGMRPKILYATQAEVNPPTFVFFVRHPELIHFSYQRYLENRLREKFGFYGTPVRLIFRARS